MVCQLKVDMGGKMKARRTIWTPMQIENLRRLIKEYSVKEVAQIMNVTENAVNTACTKFGISRASIRVKQSEEEDQFLIRNAGFMSIQRMLIVRQKLCCCTEQGMYAP